MVEIEPTELAKRASVVNDQYKGILPYHEIFYIESIKYSAGRSLEAFERYEYFLDKDVAPDYPYNDS